MSFYTLPWNDTPNWQGMGRKWLVECVFRSMCAQLALIWQPKNTKILIKLFHTSLSIFKALWSFSDRTHSALAPSFQTRLIFSKPWSHFRILKKALPAHPLHSKSERPFTPYFSKFPTLALFDAPSHNTALAIPKDITDISSDCFFNVICTYFLLVQYFHSIIGFFFFVLCQHNSAKRSCPQGF